MSLMEIFNMAVSLLAVVSVLALVLLRTYEFLGGYRQHRLRRRHVKLRQQFLERQSGGKGGKGGGRGRNRKQLPSLSRGLVGLAIRRLPREMGAAERRRWADEMWADVGSIARRRTRLRVAFNIWRKGAPAIPANQGGAPRRASE
jgi:hypothetical protein